MSPHILQMDDGSLDDGKLVGGKGANLAVLVRAGYTVPSFFVLTTRAYQEFISTAGVKPSFDLLLRHLESEEPDYPEEVVQKVRQKILAQSIPSVLQREIMQAYRELDEANPEPAVAVRSSAVCEDQAAHSFAGQLETYLNIRGVDKLLEAIKRCWVSMLNERVLSYYMTCTHPRPEFSMAVVVQKMIPARASGVVFTTIRTNGNEDQIMIEANWGLGTTVVAGRALPDNYCVDKTTLSVSSEKIADKAVADFPRSGTSSGVQQVELPALQRSVRVLKEEQIRKLSQISLNIEKQFGCPQDIEWALLGDTFYILQARPITKAIAEFKARPTPRGKIWTNYFFAERFPQPVSPLGWSVLKPLIEKNAFRDPLHYLGFHKLARGVLTRCFYGRPYTDLDVFRALHSCFPPFLVSPDKRAHFYDHGKQYSSPMKKWKSFFAIILSLSKNLLRDSNWFIPLHLRRWETFVPYYQRQLEEIEQTDLSQKSPQELRVLFQKAESMTDQLLSLHRWSITFAEILYHLLEKLLQRWFPEKDGNLLVDLVSGLEGNQTVEMNLNLWQLSTIVTQHSSLRVFFFEQKPASEILKKLGGTAEGEHFLKAYQLFLNKYGHRSNSLDLFYPTWEEDTHYVLEMIKKYVGLTSTENPIRMEARKRQRRVEKTHEIIGRLSAQGFFSFLNWKSFVFKKLLLWVQKFVLLRENQRYYWHIALARMRKIILEWAIRFVNDGIIDQRDDIFFLKLSEIDQLLSEGGDKKDTYKTKIVFRKGRREADQRVKPLSLIREDGFDHSSKIAETKGLKLEGIGVSPGRVTGSARVLTNLIHYERLNKGEILVTPSTDPGWTPLYGLISGLVMEVGGVLSHGAILAREFGIPAVANVSEATSKIRNGDQLIIDGDSGTVIQVNR